MAGLLQRGAGHINSLRGLSDGVGQEKRPRHTAECIHALCSRQCAIPFTFGSPCGPAGVDDERSIMLLGSIWTGQPLQCQLRSSVLLHVGICRQQKMRPQRLSASGHAAALACSYKALLCNVGLQVAEIYHGGSAHLRWASSILDACCTLPQALCMYGKDDSWLHVMANLKYNHLSECHRLQPGHIGRVVRIHRSVWADGCTINQHRLSD